MPLLTPRAVVPCTLGIHTHTHVHMQVHRFLIFCTTCLERSFSSSTWNAAFQVPHLSGTRRLLTTSAVLAPPLQASLRGRGPLWCQHPAAVGPSHDGGLR